MAHGPREAVAEWPIRVLEPRKDLDDLFEEVWVDTDT